MNVTPLQNTSNGITSRAQKYKKKCRLTTFLSKKMAKHFPNDSILTKTTTPTTAKRVA